MADGFPIDANRWLLVASLVMSSGATVATITNAASVPVLYDSNDAARDLQLRDQSLAFMTKRIDEISEELKAMRLDISRIDRGGSLKPTAELETRFRAIEDELERTHPDD